MDTKELTIMASAFENVDAIGIKVEYICRKEYKNDDIQQIHISKNVNEDTQIEVKFNIDMSKLLVGLAKLPQAKEVANLNHVLWIIKNYSSQVISNKYLAEENHDAFIKFIEKQSNISKFDM